MNGAPLPLCTPGSNVCVPVATADTDCLRLFGDGTGGDPVRGFLEFAATVTDPDFGPIANGAVCGPSGIEVQPDRRTSFTGPFGLGGGLVPPLVADTAPGPHLFGLADWGPPVLAAGVGMDPNRPTVFLRIEQRPFIVATLEPGARVDVGHSTDFPTFDIIDWTMTNTGSVIGTWAVWLGNLNGLSSAAPGVGVPGPTETFQLTARTIGFTGASSLATLLGTTINVAYLGFPI